MKCPFCLNDDNRVLRDLEWEHYYVFCDCCEACGPSAQTEERALKLWEEMSMNLKEVSALALKFTREKSKPASELTVREFVEWVQESHHA
jgi:hypothetical protein